jgi:hypothetical protein
MYAVEVRDHIMIAHSFRGDLFGPAQAVHGATFVVDVAFGPLNYRNLDDLPQFSGQNTTTEFLSRHIFDAMAEAARSGALGPGSEGVSRIRVTLHESHVARAWYEGAVHRG